MQDTIIDGELVEDKHKDPQAKEHGKFNIHFLIFDVLYIEGTNLCKDKWDIRMDYSKKGIVQYRELFFQKHPEKRMEEDFDIEEKKQWKMEDIMDLKEYMNDPELNHNTDGVILTPLDLHFVKGRCDQILKMKPIELNSVDFRASWGNGVCYLSVANDVKDGKTFHEDIPIAIFDFEDEEVKASVKDGTIIECVMDLLQEEIDADPTKQCFFTKGWRPLRIRVDKDSANAYGTFVGVFKSIQDDITYKTLHNMFPK